MMDRLYEFYEIPSKTMLLPGEERLVGAIRGYRYVLQHTLEGVEILDAPTYDGLPDGLLELRAFDGQGEIHLVSFEDRLVGRVRLDGEGSLATVYDEDHVLWGTRLVEREGTAELLEDRGTRVRLYLDALPGFVDGSSVATIRVRNYLVDDDEADSESGDTPFAFYDWRLACIDVRKGD